METAVDLVSIYLQLNGYFVQTEVPVVQRVPGCADEAARFEQVTDVDILAVRFPSLAHLEEPREREEWAGTVAPKNLEGTSIAPLLNGKEFKRKNEPSELF